MIVASGDVDRPGAGVDEAGVRCHRVRGGGVPADRVGGEAAIRHSRIEPHVDHFGVIGHTCVAATAASEARRQAVRRASQVAVADPQSRAREPAEVGAVADLDAILLAVATGRWAAAVASVEGVAGALAAEVARAETGGLAGGPAEVGAVADLDLVLGVVAAGHRWAAASSIEALAIRVAGQPTRGQPEGLAGLVPEGLPVAELAPLDLVVATLGASVARGHARRCLSAVAAGGTENQEQREGSAHASGSLPRTSPPGKVRGGAREGLTGRPEG